MQFVSDKNLHTIEIFKIIEVYRKRKNNKT